MTLQHHIFLSYSRKDLSIMQRIRDDLRAAGLRVWTDEGIEPGSISWKEAIEHAIRETHIVVTLLSPSANDSKWVQREIDYAEVHQKENIPVLIDGHPRDAIPFALAGAQFVDVRQNYAKGINSLKKQCVEQLEINESITLVHRSEVTIPAPVRYKTQALNTAMISSMILLVLALVLLLWFSLSNNAEAAATPDSPHILLRYTRDTLVFMNNSDGIFPMQDIIFEVDDERIRFEAEIWGQESLRVGRCLQVWRQERTYLSPDDAPADACFSRIAYRATSQLFWISDNTTDVFVIRRSDAILGTCPVIANEDNAILLCRINL